MPHALVVTPNLFEAAILAGVEPRDDTDVGAMADLAAAVHRLGATWVLVKGGHLPGVHGSGPGPAPERVADVLFDGTDVTVLEQDRVATRNNHGTGCSLAVGHAALLARVPTSPRPCRWAKRLRARALVGAARWDLGPRARASRPFGWSHG